MNSDVVNLANMIYGEVGSLDKNAMHMVGSTAINRLKSGRRKEFGENLQDVLQKGYYAVSDANDMYKQAMSQKFPDDNSANKYKMAYAVASGLLSGKLQPTQGQFYFTDDEIKKMKAKKKSFDFKAVKNLGKMNKYQVFGY